MTHLWYNGESGSQLMQPYFRGVDAIDDYAAPCRLYQAE